MKNLTHTKIFSFTNKIFCFVTPINFFTDILYTCKVSYHRINLELKFIMLYVPDSFYSYLSVLVFFTSIRVQYLNGYNIMEYQY